MYSGPAPKVVNTGGKSRCSQEKETLSRIVRIQYSGQNNNNNNSRLVEWKNKVGHDVSWVVVLQKVGQLSLRMVMMSEDADGQEKEFHAFKTSISALSTTTIARRAWAAPKEKEMGEKSCLPLSGHPFFK